jgi:hypothetical protein
MHSRGERGVQALRQAFCDNCLRGDREDGGRVGLQGLYVSSVSHFTTGTCNIQIPSVSGSEMRYSRPILEDSRQR